MLLLPPALVYLMLATLCTHSGIREVARPLSPTQGLYNTRVKYFGDLTVVTCFSRPVFNPLGLETYKKKDKQDESIYIYDSETDTISLKLVDGKTVIDPFTGEIMKVSNYREPRKRTDSIKRARDKAFEIAHANNFTYFVTLTLDESKISRYDTAEISKKLFKWLNNQQQRNDLHYLIIPEYHKRVNEDGKSAIHFHGLLSGNLRYIDSGHKTDKGQTIYNLDNWHYGFTTAVQLDDNYSRVVNYVMKYITKDCNKILGRWYLSGGKDLKRSVPTDFMNIDFQAFDGTEYEVLPARLSVKYKSICT